ncbi:MAG TPA: PVC-type heme-binding CxxCH protein [Pirellulaceae bacterium]|jgi:putative membrane-bound dehydrogenase-like protein
MRSPIALALSLVSLLIATAISLAADEPKLTLNKGDHVVLIGNTLAERMQYFGNFETLLHSRFPELELVVRDLGWSADEIVVRPRSQSFVDHGHTLADHKADVILAFFGFNESFGGARGLKKFEEDLEKFIEETLATKYNGKSAPRLVVFSPIAHENIGRRGYPDGAKTNENIEHYAESMRQIAAKHKVPYVDLFAPSKKVMDQAGTTKLTINGIHLNENGDKAIAEVIDESLFGKRPASKADLSKLKAEVNEKNLQFFYDYRAVNGFYIYGGRKNPFGVVNFPVEFAKLRKMIANRDQRVWAVAQGKSVPTTIDDSNTGENPTIETNIGNANAGKNRKDNIISMSSPAEAQQKFTLPEGYEVNLFASEVEFPDLQKPVAFAFDAKGRLWVCTTPSYPQYVPGSPPNDKILIFEDTNGDGRADKQTVFADKLYLPLAIEFFGGGVIVSQQPNVMFLKDTNGDDKADTRELILHGLDTADSHHACHAFVFDPGGAMYFNEGTFHHSQIETPWGPERCANAGVFRYEPRTGKLDVFVSYGFANPWGQIFDTWGQNFVADASGGANYYGTAFSGDVDYPHKHANLKHFLTKQWRPTCGCELISSRNFPPEVQGNFLLNNCIGFQGTLQYKLHDDSLVGHASSLPKDGKTPSIGSGFHADPIDPLIQSSDPSYRPVDIEFAPDGSLYLADWYNPLVGHMQHSIRDPNRDHSHGRIWRVTYKNRPLVKPAKIDGQPIAALLDLLRTEPEERTHYRVRTELWNRPTADVIGETAKWLAGLAKNDPNYEHHKLEALWLHQAHDTINEPLLKELLRSTDFRARAASTRVLGYWRDRVAKPLDLLREQVSDDHPRVRLEAIRALSFFGSQDAIDVAVESLVFDQDDYLKYTFNETMKTLERRVKGQTNLPHEGTDWDKRHAEGYKVPAAEKTKSK